MDKFERMERLYKQHQKELHEAKTIQELISLNVHEGKPIYTMKFFNKKFKGNFLKAQEYVIRHSRIGFANAVEAQMEGVY